MPIYEGVCLEHGRFERILPQLGHPPAKLRCTECTKSVPREPSAGAFILKAGAGGFYKPSKGDKE